MTKKFVFILLFALVALPALAGAGPTTAGNVTVTSNNLSLWVSAAYTGDANANNTCKVEYRLSSSEEWLLWQDLPHSASAYKTKITGLTNGSAYDVRVTFSDADGVTGTNPRLVYRTVPSLLMHNSDNTTQGTVKWPGGWGIPGGKYGQFECGTCHVPRDTNISGIRPVIATPDGSNWTSTGLPGATVSFLSKTAGSGDDAGGHATSSKVCEVCHSRNNYHNYNTENNTGGLDHNNAVDCMSCHSHKNGFRHGGSGTGCGTSTTCHGTVRSHPTHVNGSGGKGLSVACSQCHNTTNFPAFRSKADPNAMLTLSETDICNDCHSPGGTYDGVNDAALGARNNWVNGVYSGANLAAGKEKWCATCHDETPSSISGISAPNVVGGEGSTYTYGTGWGFYKTGHGLSSSSKYPASGGITAGAGLGCNSCHDLSTAHIDGNARTFDCGDGCDSAEYRAGYRLKLTGGQEPMFMPWPQNNDNSADRYRLCVSCHNSGPFLNSGDANTNFKTDGVNRHESHLVMNTVKFPADYNYAAGYNSRITCVNCHNVHGSTRLAMVNDGKLIGREPGMRMWYRNDDIVDWSSSSSNPPVPENLTLAASTGTLVLYNTTSNLCGQCHTAAVMVGESRAPYQNVQQPPALAWTGENSYTADGVNPDSAASGSNFTFRVKYSDANNDAPASIQVWVDLNDNGSYGEDEKYNMTAVDAGDTAYTDGKLYTKTLAMAKAGDNTFNYRFYASDGSEAAGAPTQNNTVAVTNNAPVLAWTGENDYVNDGVNPDTGGSGSSFVFRVRYTDADNTAPSSMRAWIDLNDNGTYEDGEKFDMNEVDAGDTNYADGKLYTYTRALSHAGDGDLRYRFYASDGIDSATGSPTSDSTVTVLSSANTPPSLSWISASCMTNGSRPSVGATGSDFEFRVRYTDLNNTPPSSLKVWIDVNDNGTYEDGEKFNMSAVDAGDTDYTDGKLYTYTRAIDYAGDGVLKYRFYASDGTDPAVGSPIADNTLTAVNNVLKVRPTGGAGWYDTLSGAISSSSDPSTILVYPNSDFTAATYAGGITLSSKSNRTLQSVCGADLTIISGGAEVIQLATSNGVTLDGFTVTGGTARGVYLNNSSNFTLKNSKAHTNGTYGVYFLNTCNPVSIQNSSIYSNTSGGVYVSAASLLSLSGSSIYSNGGSVNGAGIYYSGGGTHTITSTTIRNNSTTLSGGAIYINGGSLTITNSVITGNQAGTNGGAICTNTGPTVSIINSTVADNQGAVGGGIFVCAIGSTEIRNSIFWNNTSTDGNGANIYKSCGAGGDIGTISYSDISTASPSIYNTTFTDGGGNLSPAQDPIFAAPASNDYSLQSVSPCRDTITPVNYNGPADDIAGNSRPRNTNYDMGAYEYVPANNNPLLSWTGEAGYVSDGVGPGSAAGGSAFEFRIDYTDEDNNAPTAMQVWVDKNDNGEYEADEKYEMTAVDGGDTTYTDGKRYSKTLNIQYAGDGNIRYRSYASDGTNEATGMPATHSMVVINNNVPVLAWTGEVNYAADGVNPDSDANGKTFTFRVKYTDGDNYAPTSMQVWVDTNDNGSYEEGEKYNMTPDGGDGDYTNGEIYQKALTLYRAGDGTFNYRSYATDGTAAAVGPPVSDSTVTVTNNAPVLAWKGDGGYVNDGSDPDSGPNGTSFVFKVRYTDADNTPPTVMQVWVDTNDNGSYEEGEKYNMTVDGGDGDYSNGELFTKTLLLNHLGSGDGVLNYRSYGHDGASAASGDPATDKTVTISGTNNPPVLSWAAANCLTEGIRPRTGALNADFEFRVKYSDADNNCASAIQVTVNGTPYELTGNDGASCETGRTYYRTIALAAAGDLDYSFSASDGTDAATGTPTTNHVVSVVNTPYKVRPAGGAGWYATIGAAITASADPSTIIVYPNGDFTAATYSESVSLSSKNNRTVQSACGQELSIISGTLPLTVQTSANIIVDGFSMTAGTTYGIYVNGTGNTALRIKNSKVYGNATGIYINDSDSIPVEIEKVEIYGNSLRGINLVNADDKANITDSVIHSHNVTSTGAAINMGNACTVALTRSVIRDNTTSGSGGAIYINLGSLTITNSVISGNQSSANGGAICTNSGPTVSIINSTVADNQGNNGGVFYICAAGSTEIRNSIFWNNTAVSGNGANIYKACGAGNIGTISYSDISTASPAVFNATFTDGGGNMSPAQDPLFINAAADNYRIQAGSPCKDAITPANYNGPADDLDGYSRPWNTNYDMGADEYAP